MPFLHGLHDLGGEDYMSQAPGHIVHAVSLSETPNFDYRSYSSRGFKIVCRLNWGWNPNGTIPLPDKYSEMAQKCRNFVRDSQGCSEWIIGNEFNHAVERPHGNIIQARSAAECHKLCYQAIKSVGIQHKVLMGAIAPWNLTTGNWLDYLYAMASEVGNLTDGYALHAYTHGEDPNLIFSSEERHGWMWHFRTYRDQIDRILQADPRARSKIFKITESNQGDKEWVDVNNNWIRNALSEIDDFNKDESNPKVSAVCFYRFRTYKDDRWHMEDKPNLLEAFRSAASLKFPSPEGSKYPLDVYLPVVGGGKEEGDGGALPPPDLMWDLELTRNGVEIIKPKLNSGDIYWRVVYGNRLNEQESQGRHHIFVNALDTSGKRIPNVRFVVATATEEFPFVADKDHRDPYSGNFPMSPGNDAFTIRVDQSGEKSDTVIDLDMGADTPGGFNAGIHTSVELHFVRDVYYGVDPIIKVNPTVPIVIPNPSSNWLRSREFVKRWEGGFQKFENDAGNWTGCAVGVGKLVGTKFGISACSYPNLDIPNITMSVADEIYFNDYWKFIGADKLPWPNCLIAFDTAVLHGRNGARSWMAEVGTDGYAIAAKRLNVYVNSKNWNFWGNAWTRRVKDLLLEVSKRL